MVHWDHKNELDENEPEVKKNSRGHFFQVERKSCAACVAGQIRESGNIDQSSFFGTAKGKRWNKAPREFVEIDRRKIVEEYNKYMRGIDLHIISWLQVLNM